MSLPRLAAWGAVGGLLLSVIFVLVAALAGDTALEILALGPVFALSGAASAAGSLAIARRVEGRGLLGADGDVDETGLGEGRPRERLGNED